MHKCTRLTFSFEQWRRQSVDSTGQANGANGANGHPTVKSLEWASALWHVRQSLLLELVLSGGFIGESGLRSCAMPDRGSLSCTTQFHPSKLTGDATDTTAFSGVCHSQSLPHIFSCSLCSAVKILCKPLSASTSAHCSCFALSPRLVLPVPVITPESPPQRLELSCPYITPAAACWSLQSL